MVENQYHHTRLFNVEYIWYRSNKTSIYSGFSHICLWFSLDFPMIYIFKAGFPSHVWCHRGPKKLVAEWQGGANTQAIHEKVPELGIPWRRVEFPGKRWDNMWGKHEGKYTEICEKCGEHMGQIWRNLGIIWRENMRNTKDKYRI